MAKPPVRVPALLTADRFLAALFSGVAWYLADDWIAAAGIVVLWAGWRLLRTPTGPPVLALAFSFQWMQVTLGVYYHALTGRPSRTIETADYRTMVILGLGCILVLALGLRAGLWLASRGRAITDAKDERTFRWVDLIVGFVTLTLIMGTVRDFAFSNPALTQIILALTYVRLALLFVMIRRLCVPRIRWNWLGLLLLIEVAQGFTGYFADFREPLLLTAVALLETFDRRRAGHWLVLGLLGVAMVTMAVVWMNVRNDYRRAVESEWIEDSRLARFERFVDLTTAWLEKGGTGVFESLDEIVDRLWVVYYPALAVARVPSAVPHENGALLAAALRHLVTPRFLFPEKPDLPSDSDLVQKYSGLILTQVSTQLPTSLAFGYAGESYVDFGVPGMFVPVLIYGFLMGVAYWRLLLLIRNRELAVAIVTAIFWVSLYSFERSWVMHLGGAVSRLLYLGGAAVLFDRMFLVAPKAARKEPAAPFLPGAAETEVER